MKRTRFIFISMIRWIEENISMEIGVNDIVSKSGYSKRYVQYLFRKHLGCGIYTYLKNRRLSLSAKLLKLTKMPMIEICHIYHFKSYQSFNRAFKIKFRIPPGRYRRTTNWLLSRYTGNAALERPKMISTPVLLPCLEVLLKPKKIIASTHDGNYNNVFDGEAISEIKKHVRTLVMKNKNEKLMMIYRVNVSTKSNFALEIELSEVKDKQNSASFQRRIIEAGMYYQFHYEGIWDEYDNLSDYIYLNELPSLNMNKRNSHDIQVFDICAMREKTKLVVDIYVPVTTEFY